jgi:septal ring factor EnvC (AmiA/AmiB activator)
MKKGLILVGCLALAAGPAVGRHAAVQSDELRSLQAEYRDELARSRRLRADAQEAAAELAELNRRLGGLEKARDDDDAQIIAQRNRLDQLSRRDAELAIRLSRTQGGQTRLLSALQMMSRRPPPPLLVPAERATDTGDDARAATPGAGRGRRAGGGRAGASSGRAGVRAAADGGERPDRSPGRDRTAASGRWADGRRC